MLIVARESIDRALKQNATARKPTARWFEIASAAEWRDITDARNTFQTADSIKGTNLTCFNIGGNSFRLLAIVSYSRQQIVIRELLTHAEYTKKYEG